ncbi:MAG: energy transducer TonB [candidate division NC10 bacterium]
MSDGTLGSSAPGAQVASSGPRTESGAGIGAAGGGATGVAPGGRDGGKGLGVSGGSRLALALPGEGRGGVPAEYGPYLARFRQRVQDALVYPLAARRRGLSGAVELEVLIDPGGRVQNVAVSSSSSHALLDEAAADTVRQMAPVPMPETLPARPLRVKLPLVFELR